MSDCVFDAFDAGEFITALMGSSHFRNSPEEKRSKMSGHSEEKRRQQAPSID